MKTIESNPEGNTYCFEKNTSHSVSSAIIYLQHPRISDCSLFGLSIFAIKPVISYSNSLIYESFFGYPIKIQPFALKLLISSSSF